MLGDEFQSIHSSRNGEREGLSSDASSDSSMVEKDKWSFPIELPPGIRHNAGIDIGPSVILPDSDRSTEMVC